MTKGQEWLSRMEGGTETLEGEQVHRAGSMQRGCILRAFVVDLIGWCLNALARHWIGVTEPNEQLQRLEMVGSATMKMQLTYERRRLCTRLTTRPERSHSSWARRTVEQRPLVRTKSVCMRTYYVFLASCCFSTSTT
jgi:hypothetical protein